ncbi:hypothetical protein [Rhodococcus pyridinivorans]|uniref:hypothetical protein n=1 Tax=Rhodococcus pyridinivorans TaxID=103816 RepID=UPI001E37D3CD|nr:hypothetical protein [Rhodococcus pyridinivorans]
MPYGRDYPDVEWLDEDGVLHREDDSPEGTENIRPLGAVPDDPEAWFWKQRPILQHIRDFARSRTTPPWAVLGHTLLRAIASIEPNVVLPPIVGSVAGLNQYIAVCDVSGGGKSSAFGVARDAVKFVAQHAGGKRVEIITQTVPAGTGEGLAKLFRRVGDEDDDRPSRAIMNVAEIGTLRALAARQGATLNDQLLAAYIGEQIGFQNASASTNSVLQPQTYRLCMAVGVQPENADALLSGAKDGLPQRFLWLPATDPYATWPIPAQPEPVEVLVTNYAADTVEVEVPDAVAEEIKWARFQRLTGASTDPMASHRFLCQEKTAVGLAILEGRISITEDDWKIAGQIMRVSDRTRERMIRVLEGQRRKANRAKAVERAEVDGIVADHAEERLYSRARAAVIRRLGRGGVVQRKEIRTSMRSELKRHLDSVLSELILEGVVAEKDGGYVLA